MGKPTGFMDYKRAELALRAPEERIKDWQEIKTSSLPHKEALRCQAARCMDCGVPFCHSGVMIKRMVSGCPLHNLMPEFNDLVYHGMDDYAYAGAPGYGLCGQRRATARGIQAGEGT